KAVSAHVEDCAECAKIAEQLPRTSRALSAWKVSAVPVTVEDYVTELAAEAGSGIRIKKPKLLVRVSFWGWKQWALVSAGAMSSLLFVVAMLTPSLMRTEFASLPRQEMRSSATAQRREFPQQREEQLRAAEKFETTDGALADDRLAFTAQSSASASKPQVQVHNGQPARAGAPVSAPMIARAVSLAIVVKDFAAARASVDNILARHQGYSSQMNVNTAENAPRSLQASLRIPAPALSGAINDLRSLGRIARETQSGEDVTRQHADLVARLKNSRDTEQRLRDILRQRTGKVADVLEVEQEISRVRGEIEEMESEQK